MRACVLQVEISGQLALGLFIKWSRVNYLFFHIVLLAKFWRPSALCLSYHSPLLAGREGNNNIHLHELEFELMCWVPLAACARQAVPVDSNSTKPHQHAVINGPEERAPLQSVGQFVKGQRECGTVRQALAAEHAAAEYTQIHSQASWIVDSFWAPQAVN